MKKIKLPEDIIVTQYELGQSCTSLSKLYRVCIKTILRILKAKNIRVRAQGSENRKYFVNESFFDLIDTEEKAYFVGLLYADGDISPERNSIVISLEEHDKDILEKYSRIIFKNERPLQYCKGKVTTILNREGINARPSYRLVITNKHMCDSVSKLGVVKAKTKKIEFPEWLSVELYSHFMRGYIDGDGSIYINGKRKAGEVSFTGTDAFCLSFKSICSVKFGITPRIKPHPTSEGISTLIIYRQADVLTFLEWLYKDATVYLERKHSKFEKLKLIRDKIINKPICCKLCGNKHYSKGLCSYHYHQLIYLKNKRV